MSLSPPDSCPAPLLEEVHHGLGTEILLELRLGGRHVGGKGRLEAHLLRGRLLELGTVRQGGLSDCPAPEHRLLRDELAAILGLDLLQLGAVSRGDGTGQSFGCLHVELLFRLSKKEGKRRGGEGERNSYKYKDE